MLRAIATNWAAPGPIGGTAPASGNFTDVVVRSLGWSATGASPGDLFLQRDAANILAQRNGTAAQSFRLYNTFTDASNYERVNMAWSGNNCLLEIGAAGTGQARNLILSPTADLVISTANVAERWRVVATDGSFIPSSNGGPSIGAGSAGIGKLYIDYTNTATVGAVTINKAAGRVNIAAGATTIVVTNSLVTAASKVFPVPVQADANNPLLRSVVPAAGSFTITVSAAPAANQAWDFFVVNTD